MQTIINQSLNDMLDKLLNKALKTKPITINETIFTYDKFKVYKDEVDCEITILMKKNNTESMGQYITYMYDLTDEQKELINKIFEKWNNTDDRNSK